jgi:hypothetical protein
MATEKDDEPNVMQEAFAHLRDRDNDGCVGVGVMATREGSTYPALIDMETDEVLALLVIPPRAYDFNMVN